MLSRIWVFPFSLAAALPAAAQNLGPVSLAERPAVTVEAATDSGTTTLQVISTGAGEVKLALTVGQLKSSVTGRVFSATIAFPDEKGEDKSRYTGSIQPGDLLPIKLQVTHVPEAGESVAAIRNKDREIGTLVVQRKFPFSVKLAVATPDAPEITFEHWKNGVLSLKNDDPYFYPVYWELRVGSHAVSGRHVALSPNASVPVELYPPGDWFRGWLAGLYRDDIRDGAVRVVYWPDGGDARTPPAGAPSQTLPVKVRLQYWPGWFRATAGWLLLAFILTAGGLTSLYTSYALPNLLRRFSARDRLREMAARIDGIGSRVDSRLRVLIRVEWRRLREMMYSRSIMSPEYTDLMTRWDDLINTLAARVDLASQLDSLREQFEQLGGPISPPTFVAITDRALQDVADALRKSQPVQSDFDAARTALAKATALLQNPMSVDCIKEIAARVTRLIRDLAPFAAPSPAPTPYQVISQRLPLLFAALKPELGDPANIAPPDFPGLDVQTSKLLVVLDYLQLYDGATSTPFRAKLQDNQERLLEHLEQNSWEGYQRARLLVANMKCGIYPEDLIQELIEHREAVSITMEPPAGRTNQPLEFSVTFHKPEFDHSAAKGQLTYNWRAVSEEVGEKFWSVWSYLPLNPNPSEVTIDMRVTFEYDGRPVLAQDKAVEISRSFPLRNYPESFNERTKAELTRLGISLAIAIFGLVAGAKDQLTKLDMMSGLIAVFLLGFGADQVKSILSQSPAAAKK